MKQIKAFGPQELRVVVSPAPSPGEGEVLIDVRACGICGSDKWFWHVEGPTDRVAGHEAAGEVVAVGPGVAGLRIGDRVAVNNVKGCGACDECRAGAYVRCPNGVRHMGFGFSERITAPERNCLKLHPSIDFEAGSLIFDNWGTPHSALKRTAMKEGDTVAVIGCGPIGLAAMALAGHRRARVFTVDPLPERRAMSVRLGAERALAPADGAADELSALAGGKGVDYVVECSGKASSYELAFAALRIGGTLVSIGEKAMFTLSSSEIIHKHLTIVGSLYSTVEAGAEVQELMASGAIDPFAFVTHRIPLERLPERFGDVIEARDGLIKAIVVR